VKDVPRFYRNPGRAVLWLQNGLGGLGGEVTETEYASQNLVQARIFPELEALGAEVIDPLPWLKQAGGESGYVAADGRGFFYFDRDHLSVHGARAVEGAFFPELEALGAEVIDPLPWLKQAGGESGYVAADGRGFFYFDRDHLSVHGARAVEGAFAVVGERRVAGR
jgi:hypothetical protein